MRLAIYHPEGPDGPCEPSDSSGLAIADALLGIHGRLERADRDRNAEASAIAAVVARLRSVKDIDGSCVRGRHYADRIEYLAELLADYGRCLAGARIEGCLDEDYWCLLWSEVRDGLEAVANDVVTDCSNAAWSDGDAW